MKDKTVFTFPSDSIPKSPAVLLFKIRMLEEMLTYPWDIDFTESMENKLKIYRKRLQEINYDYSHD